MRLAWLWLPALSLAACVTQDSPSLSLSVDPQAQALFVRLERGPTHSFDALSATVNGADADPPTVSPGHESDHWGDVDAGAVASWSFPLAALERDVLAEVTEGGDTFVIEAPDLLAPRAVNLHGSLDALRADDWIELDSGEPTDNLAGGFTASLDGFCFTQWDTQVRGTALALRLPPAGTFDGCAPVGETNAPGTSREVELEISLWSTTPVTRCEGPGLTCAPVSAGWTTQTFPATLRF